MALSYDQALDRAITALLLEAVEHSARCGTSWNRWDIW